MRVLVIGVSTIGHEISEICAIMGHDVTMVDVNDEVLKKAIEKITRSLKKLAEKIALVSPEEVLMKIKITTDLVKAAEEADFVIESVAENVEVKKEVFKILDERCREDVILTTNTSTIPISEIASATSRPDKVIGLHFFNQPMLTRIVEIVRGERTSDETLSKALEFARSIGMDHVLVNKDVPGFLINRINLRILVEALRMLEEGCKPEEIDSTMKYRLGLPIGVLEAVDLNGIDVMYHILNGVARRGMKIKPPRIVEEMVRMGKLGMKTGEGFYKYEEVRGKVRIPANLAYQVNPLRLIAPAINEAAWLIRNEIASKEDIDKATMLGMGHPYGLLEIADSYGLDLVVEMLEKRKQESGLDEYEVDPQLKEMVGARRLGKKTGEGFYRWNYECIEIGPVIYEKRHNYALITMNRPDKLNALNDEMWIGLNKAFLKAEEDKDVRVVVVTGKGRAFCAGDDIAVMCSWQRFLDGKEFFEKVAMPLINTLSRYTKPIISLVNGHAFGGGMELNLLFDVVIASENASFAVPEGLVGALPPIASTLGVALIGRKIAMYCLTGESMDAEVAKALGIVDVVVPHDQLELVGVEYVNKICRVAPLSTKAIKSSMNSLRHIFFSAMLTGMHELIELTPTNDFKEGTRAFIMRTRPRWKGE